MRTGIRGRAVLAAGIAILPLLALDLYSFEKHRRQVLSDVRMDALVLARDVAHDQAAIFANTRQLLQGFALSTRREGEGLLGPQCSEQLRSLVEIGSTYYQAVIADPAGNARCAALPLRTVLNIGDRDYFRRALESRGFVLSDVVIGRDTGRTTVLGAHALLGSDGKALGVLVAALDFAWLKDRLERAALPPGAVLSIVDAAGTIAARFPTGEDYVGKPIPDLDAFRNAAASKSEGVADVRGHDGIERVVAFAAVPRLPASPMFVRVGIPRSVVDKAALERLKPELSALAIVAALALILAWLSMDRLVVRPLRRLAGAADRLGQGDLSARTGLSHGPTEMGQLARKLDYLAEHSERVSRALRTLSAGNRTLLRERDERALLHAMCKVAVEKGGYPLAFVSAAVHDADKSIAVTAHAGRSDGLLELLNMTWADTERGQGTVARAIRTREPSVIRSIATDPRAAPWRELLLKRGFGSVISLPLRLEGQVIGTFTFFAPEEDSFDAAEVELLRELANDLSFGIETIRAQARLTAAEARAKRAETHDVVTDLLNRNAFVPLLEGEIARTGSEREPVAVLVAHFPAMQQIFDGFGYGPATEITREVAARLAHAGGPGRIARVSLDDFGIVCTNTDAERSRAEAERIATAFDAPIRLGELEIDARPAFGASLFPGHGAEPDLLLRRAVIAAHDAARRDLPYAPYRGATAAENPQRLALAGELRHAIEERTLTLHYQPKIVLADGGLHGAEALARWSHPVKGMIPPGQFVPVAEQSGLIRPLTYFVVDAAVRQLRAWIDAGKRVPVAVNVSARNLHDPRFLERVEGLLGTWGVPGELLEFEITEGALVEDSEHAKAVLKDLRALAGRIYIDDFGTGYSSLGYLAALPVDALKIDRSFILAMAKSQNARTLVKSVISMAHALGLGVVAEGVETEEDAALLREMGCDEAQGYFYGKPVPAVEFAQWLA